MVVVSKKTGVTSEAYSMKREEDLFAINNYLREPIRQVYNSQREYITVKDRVVTGYYSYLDFITLFDMVDDFYQIPKALMDKIVLFSASCDDIVDDSEEFTLKELVNKLEAIYDTPVLDKINDINLSLRLRVFSDGADTELSTKQLRIETDEEFEQRRTERYYELQNRRSERVSKLKKEATALGIELTEDQLKKLEN